MKEVAGMLTRRFENFITYSRHRISKAASESLNANIQRSSGSNIELRYTIYRGRLRD
jgi:hypothetical protein